MRSLGKSGEGVMPAELRPGYDHPHLDYAPDAPFHHAQLRGVLVTPVMLLETYEDPVPDWPQLRSVGGGLDRAFPNISRVSTREYGHRVGIFRMLDALAERGLRPVAAVDALTAERYPWLIKRLAAVGTEWVAHGISVTRPIGSHLSEDEERAYVRETLERLAAEGVKTRGWLGPEYGESARTPKVLATADIDFVLDWCNDERPVPMTVPEGALIAFPMNADLDDQTTLVNRMATPADYRTHLVDAVEYLAGRDDLRALAFAVRPWILGQPFRASVFEALLEAVVTNPGARYASPTEVLDRFGHQGHLTRS
jgi:hypothetical protein